MANNNDGRIFNIRYNLSEAGIDEESIAKCLKMIDERRYSTLDRFLKDYRRTLLKTFIFIKNILIASIFSTIHLEEIKRGTII